MHANVAPPDDRFVDRIRTTSVDIEVERGSGHSGANARLAVSLHIIEVAQAVVESSLAVRQSAGCAIREQ